MSRAARPCRFLMGPSEARRPQPHEVVERAIEHCLKPSRFAVSNICCSATVDR